MFDFHMNSLKELMINIFELILNPFVGLSIICISGFLLSAYSFFPRDSAFYKLILNNYSYIFLVFVIFLIISLAKIFRNIYFCLLTKSYLSNLSLNEKRILHKYLELNQRVIYFPPKDEGVISLYHKLIISCEGVGGNIKEIYNENMEVEWPFLINNYVYKYLKKNSKLLSMPE